MNQKEEFSFEWLPGFREMMACQNNTEQSTADQSGAVQNSAAQNSTDWNSAAQNSAAQNSTDWNSAAQNATDQMMSELLPPEQLQQEEQQYWKDYEYLIQMLPMVAREVWIVADALLDQYEYTGSPMYSEYPDKVTILKIADLVYDKLKYREEQETMQADDETVVRNPYFTESSLRNVNSPFRTLIQVILHWNINYRRQRYYRRQKVFLTSQHRG